MNPGICEAKDKLASKWNKPDSNAVIVDVDCTTDDAKDLCNKYGVQGYPTLKYFTTTTSKDGDTYEDARDLKAMNKFVKRTSKLPCVPDSGENCDKKDTAYIEEIKDMTPDSLKETKNKMQKELPEIDLRSGELDDLEVEYQVSSALFEKQKEEAMATMKRSEDLKKSLSKLRDKTGYKIAILKAKTSEKSTIFSGKLSWQRISDGDPVGKDLHTAIQIEHISLPAGNTRKLFFCDGL
eukprot:s2580_g8.t1